LRQCRSASGRSPTCKMDLKNELPQPRLRIVLPTTLLRLDTDHNRTSLKIGTFRTPASNLHLRSRL
jgi:hypothetical protein